MRPRTTSPSQLENMFLSIPLKPFVLRSSSVSSFDWCLRRFLATARRHYLSAFQLNFAGENSKSPRLIHSILPPCHASVRNLGRINGCRAGGGASLRFETKSKNPGRSTYFLCRTSRKTASPDCPPTSHNKGDESAPTPLRLVLRTNAAHKTGFAWPSRILLRP